MTKRGQWYLCTYPQNIAGAGINGDIESTSIKFICPVAENYTHPSLTMPPQISSITGNNKTDTDPV